MLWIVSVKHPFRTSVDTLMKTAANNNCHLDDQIKIVQKTLTGREASETQESFKVLSDFG